MKARAETAGGSSGAEVEDVLQGRFVGGEAPMQLKEARGPDNRTGMPDRLKNGLEQLSGRDLSGVRVHYNSSKPAQVQALAYTQGQDIHVGPGQQRHLPHEGWHAVQQMEGRVRPTMRASGVAINDDVKLEREADSLGAKAQRSGRRDPGQHGPACGCGTCSPRRH
ncbi:MAG: DUF4157 domain-containing protein [bacterium]|nr:DUF4157 domain-containing protein [bacterium]